MDLDLLRMVLLVGQRGSIAGAARALDLDPSTVSRAVAAVEREIGVALFHRSTRRLGATEEGARYLARIAPLLDELDAAGEEAATARATVAGTLRLTASVAYTHECLVPLLPALADAHPDLTVELLPSDAALDLVGEGIDLAIRLGPAPTGDLVCTRLASTRYRVVASPGWRDRAGPLAGPGALSDHDCLRFTLPGFRSRWLFRAPDGAETGAEVGV
ncbi:MAG: LysR family transcriptional regulator, partial [Pseudomonadota bacterium]